MIEEIGFTLEQFCNKVVRNIEYDERYKIRINFTDDSYIFVEQDGPEGSKISVEVSVTVKRRI